MKKILALLLVAMLAMSSTALAYTVSEPGVIPVVDEMVTYELTAKDVTYICDLNENTVTQWIADNLNIQINWSEIPDTSWDEKVNILIASDELPDAFIYGGFSTSKLADYGAQGVFMDVKDLVAEHGFYINDVFEQIPGIESAYTSLDGGMYTLPNVNDCFHCDNALRCWINQKWLDNLGLAYPETWEDFVNVLRAFKEQDANGNGDPNDEIPMTGASTGWNATVYPFLINSFLYYDGGNISVDDNGQLVFCPTQEKYKEAVKAIRALFEEGLIEAEALTQTSEQLLVKGCAGDTAQVGVFTAACWWTGVDVDNGEGSRCREYVGLSPLTGPDGYRNSPTTADAIQYGDSVITTACEDPVPLFKMLDYMLSYEGTLRSQRGTVDVSYTLPPEGLTGINGKQALYIPMVDGGGSTGTEEETDYMSNLFPSNRTSDFRLGEAADYNDPDTKWLQEPRLYNETATYFEPFSHIQNRLPACNMSPEEAERVNFLQEQIDTYAKENVVLFLAGEKDIDAEWDEYVAGFEAYKLDEYLELRQTAYTRQYVTAD